ncbi:hypothetical protein [Frigoribacterium sp. VKM Ac-2530]|uniref:hypothetical protein n=1 Tax=Frigoribacterium sp. VKM Ac-2530 TaxID=2783822 RepID=UPI00188D2590|nr:hypothetical protein [Frigoribacterium sp. VKM Ac-2530]
MDATSALSDSADRLWRRLRLDRIAGGRQAEHVIHEDMREHPRTVRAFVGIRWLLLGETVVGLTAIFIAAVLWSRGEHVPWAVWFRSTVVLFITASLYVFAWRAQLGYWWAYSRLRLFSRIFPIVTLIVATIPGLYPGWMVVEQIVFSLLMIGIGDLLTTDHMRAAFPRPAKAAGAEAVVTSHRHVDS